MVTHGLQYLDLSPTVKGQELQPFKLSALDLSMVTGHSQRTVCKWLSYEVSLWLAKWIENCVEERCVVVWKEIYPAHLCCTTIKQTILSWFVMCQFQEDHWVRWALQRAPWSPRTVSASIGRWSWAWTKWQANWADQWNYQCYTSLHHLLTDSM